MLAAIMLYVFAVGGVRGFAFTLGLTTIIDLIVVFFFTKPLLTILAKIPFFNSGHPLSGFSTKSIGMVEKNPQKTEEVSNV
jgi:preprotein translocase subunit SecD